MKPGDPVYLVIGHDRWAYEIGIVLITDDFDQAAKVAKGHARKGHSGDDWAVETWRLGQAAKEPEATVSFDSRGRKR